MTPPRGLFPKAVARLLIATGVVALWLAIIVTFRLVFR